MAEPAELLIIKDQYKLAFDSLSRGLNAEEGGQTDKALEYYRKGRQHLSQGVEVPTGGERQQGQIWDKARQLQLRMRDTLRTVNAHLSDLATSQLTIGGQKRQLLKDLPPTFDPELAPNSQPLPGSLHPTIPPKTQDTILTPKRAPPPRPRSPAAAAYGLTSPAVAPAAMANSGDHPPAYTPKPTNGHSCLAYGPDGLWSGTRTGADAGRNGSELLFIPAGVQLFFVAPNGQVTALSNPGYLRIIAFDSDNKESAAAAGQPSACLHVCDWLYPLTADTPVLLANSGIFMFTDPLAVTPGSYVGIVLSSDLPAACRELFRDLLSQLADLRIQNPEETGSEVINLSTKVPLGPALEPGLKEATGEKERPLLPGWSEKMAQKILSGATWLGEGLLKGADATSRAIHRGGGKIRDNLTPEETPSEVSPHVTKSLLVTKQATGGVLRVSQFLVNGVSTVAGHVAEKVAPHVKKHGAKLIPESLKKHKEGEPSNWEGTKYVAASSVQGFSTVWTSLENGAKLVGKSVRAETVTNVTYKYGDPTGQATDTALQSVINVGVTAYNIDNLGIKAMLKTTGKQTAKAMCKSREGQTTATERKEDQKKGDGEMKK
ncbi:hypothetical protein JOB18_037193 [Solea senegalensis]|uniref:MIT domain-containing protein n=1 Tax=Solea senegalensis TaxID=28829 RepID=A0AAV6SHW2_SOLSE|nr:spartin a isoform X1 [Solea senegalensis]KAG7516649.1 hypothetical protein JOB18_037193 [Solea senegalensis]